MDVELATKLVELADNSDDFVVIGFDAVVRIVDNVVACIGSVKREVWVVVDLEVKGVV